MVVSTCNCSSLAIGETIYTSPYLVSERDSETLSLQELQA